MWMHKKWTTDACVPNPMELTAHLALIILATTSFFGTGYWQATLGSSVQFPVMVARATPAIHTESYLLGEWCCNAARLEVL